ncbi:MAG: alpha/beta hydrolase [Gemmatimonadaceae bacterium]|nr:alpha/beta hydrolase [Gemmatimonadaceae bacterium]
MSALGFTHVWQAGRSTRTLLLLHGTGGDEHDLVPLAAMLDPDAAVLSPRGPVMEHGMPRFFRRFAEGVFDLDDVARRATELRAFVDGASVAYGFDRARVTAVGFSNGANIAAAMLLQEGAVLEGAILFRAMNTITPPAPPSLQGVRVFLRPGQTDPIIRPDDAVTLSQRLAGAGADVTLEWSPGGHNLTADDVRSAAAWLRGEGTLR